ncbi:MAG TPA: TadE/TadG family type IV pilus assembly protein [Rickettsiales bacterium]|nr:TadE/TadG family type IV pilus assembly protein [Rickettsiales bacterium]
MKMLINLMRKKAKAFAADENGSMLILMAILTAFVLIVAAGFAIDITRGEILQGKMSSAFDAASLATEVEVQNPPTGYTQEAWANEVAQRYFNANFPANYLGASTITPAVTPVTSDWKTLSVSGNTNESTVLMKMAGFKTIKVGALSQVTESSQNKSVEIALVVDNSSAMSSSGRMASLQAAAGKMIDTIFGSNLTLSNTYISIIPFSDGVKIQPATANPWLSTPFSPVSGFDGCMTNRTNAAASTDNAPTGSNRFPRYIGPFDTLNNVKITGYSVNNAARTKPDLTLPYDIYQIENGAVVGGGPGGIGSVGAGSKPVRDGIRIKITDDTLDLPGGRWSKEIDYIDKDWKGNSVKRSEMVRLDLGVDYTASYANLFVHTLTNDDYTDSNCFIPASGGCVEQGQWQTYNSARTLITQGKIMGSADTYTNYAVDATKPFRYVEVSATDDGQRSYHMWAGDTPGNRDCTSYECGYAGTPENSDLGLPGFDVSPKCNLTQASFFMQDKATLKYQLSLLKADGPTRSNIGMA